MRKTLLLLLIAALPLAGFGKAAFYRKKEMIRQAEIIAVVTISEVIPTKTRRNSWTYSERASARVERVLKGNLPTEATLYGGEDFICAQVHFKPGRYLVFLEHDRDLLVGVNWHLGVRPITGDEVEWFANDQDLDLISAPLQTVLEEIKHAVAR
jgi:hypothetical protein